MGVLFLTPSLLLTLERGREEEGQRKGMGVREREGRQKRKRLGRRNKEEEKGRNKGEEEEISRIQKKQLNDNERYKIYHHFLLLNY